MLNRNVALTLGSLLLAILLLAGFPTHSKTDGASEPSVSALPLNPAPLSPGIANVVPGTHPRTASRSADSLSLNVARRGHTSTELADGRVAIIGGQNQNGPVSEVEVLDPHSQSVKVVADLKVPRSRHTATLLADGSVLVAGGWNQKASFDSTEIFNPLTNSFSRGPRLRTARAAHTATVLQDGRILLVGGSSDASAEIVDPVTHTSSLLKAKMTLARSFHATALLDDGNVLIVGGVDPEGLPLRSAEIFDTKTQMFSPTVTPMRIKRVRATLRVLPDRKVQVIGGDGDGTMEVYDPARNLFSAAAHLTPTANIFPTSKVLQSRTRAAFIDSKIALEGSVTAENAKPLVHYSIASKKALDDFDQLLERADYSSTEIDGMNRSVIAGGIGKAGEDLRSVVVADSPPAFITTNKTEYQPGERPFISGSGFQPHETISIVRQEARPAHKRKYIEAVADDLGNFTSSDISIADFQQAVTYTLTAMGERSAYVAQTTYENVRLEPAKAENIKFDMPFLFRDASFEHEEGMLVWDIRSGVRAASKPPELSIPHPSATNTYDFASIIDQPCLGLSTCPLPAAFDIQMKTGSSLTVTTGFSGSTDCDSGTVGFQPCLTITESVTGSIILEITGNGDIDLPNIPIPGASVSSMVTVAGIDFGVTLGIVAKPTLTFTAPGTTIRTTLNISQSINVNFPSGDPVTGSLTPTVAFKLVDTAGGCIKIAVGPELALEGKVTVAGCDVGADAAIFAGPYVKGCFNITNLNTCPQWSIPISVGLNAQAEGNVSFCKSIGTSFSADLFETTVATFSGTLNDHTPPTISVPSNVMQGTDPDMCGANVSFSPTASDGDCPTPTIACTPASGTFFQKGTTTVSCVATDAGGNTANGSFAVIVNDTQPPAVTCPGNITQGNDANQCSAVVTFAATATDLCDGPVTPTCTPASGSAFPRGTTTVSCTATDAAGNQSSPCTFTVKVNDTQKPTITCPGNISHGTDPDQCQAVVTFAPTTADNCDTGLVPVCNPASGSVFPKGTTTVSCTVTDTSGNQSLPCSFTVTVNDTQVPKIACGSVTPRTANADANCQAAVPDVRASVQAQSSDNCTANNLLTVTQSPAQNSIVTGAGAHPIDVTVTDEANNSTHCTVPFTVLDITPPIITCPANIISVARVSCPIAVTNVVSYPNATATDNCGVQSIVCLPPSGSAFPVGTTTVTCVATDTSGNMSTPCTFTITTFSFCLQDETNPGNVVLVNALTGDFSFCCDGVPIASGRGDLTTRGCIGTIDASKGDRQVHIQWDTAANNSTGEGTAYVLKRSNRMVCQITDKNMSNNTCQCSSPPVASPKKPPAERTF